MNPKFQRTGQRTERAMGVAALVVVLALLNLVVLGSVVSASDESNVGLLRLQSVQAFYAAEAGGMVVARVSSELASSPALGAGPGAVLTLPAAGSTATLANGAVIEFTQLPAAVADGTAVIHGRSGTCSRRVQVTLGSR